MKRLIHIFLLSLLGFTLAGRATLIRAQESQKGKPGLVEPENIQGCYELTLSPWRPNSKLGEDAVFVTPPRRIQLFAAKGTQGWESEGYVVKPAPGVEPSIHRGSYWSPKSSDSIEIVWTTGLSGLAMVLKINGTDLHGEAQTFWDFPRKKQKADVVAHKVDCQTTIVPAAPAQVDCHTDDTQPKIVPGEGWGLARIGAPFKTVEASLGKGRLESKSSGVYFKDYPNKGIQISFDIDTGSIHSIYFYNHEGSSPEFHVFCGEVEKGITWQSSVDDVKIAYGQPTSEFSGNGPEGTWRRIAFPGIDFRFENEKMVRIGVPGR